MQVTRKRKLCRPARVSRNALVYVDGMKGIPSHLTQAAGRRTVTPGGDNLLQEFAVAGAIIHPVLERLGREVRQPLAG